MKCNANGRYTYNKNKKSLKPVDYVKFSRLLASWIISSCSNDRKFERMIENLKERMIEMKHTVRNTLFRLGVSLGLIIPADLFSYFIFCNIRKDD